MKTITKTIAFLLALLMAASLLGGCGGDQPEKPKETRPAAKPAEVKWPSLDPSQLQNDALSGDWETEEAVIIFDGTDYFWYADSDRALEGNYVFDGKELHLKDLEGKVYHGQLDPRGDLRIDGFRGSFVFMGDSMGLVGSWTYQAGDLVLEFAADGTYQWQHQEETGTGEYTFDGSEVSLMEEGEVTASGYVDEDDLLHLEDMIGWFYSEGGVSYIPLSQEDQALLDPGLETDIMKRYHMENAVAIIQQETGFYDRIRADWTVGQLDNNYEGHPGFRSVTVMAACYIPYVNPAGLSGMALNQVQFTLYDRYTGITLPIVDMLKDEDGIHRYEFDSRDGRVEISFIEKERNTGSTADCRDIITIEFNLVLPDWYDGLAFAALPMPEDPEVLVGYDDRQRPPYSADMLMKPRDEVASSLTFSIR